MGNAPSASSDRAKLGVTEPSVFDNVLSPSVCHYLHTASSLGVFGIDDPDSDANSLLNRSAGTNTWLEVTLNSVLNELGDTSPYVEYWMRGTWEDIEAHQDLDEELYEQEGQRRYPRNSHVLYLKVDHDVRGPTCVWKREAGAVDGRSDFGPLTTVPAVDGRL